MSAYSDSLDRLVVVDPLRGRDGAAALQFAMAKGTIHTLNINWSSRVLEEDEEIMVRKYPPTSHRHCPSPLVVQDGDAASETPEQLFAAAFQEEGAAVLLNLLVGCPLSEDPTLPAWAACAALTDCTNLTLLHLSVTDGNNDCGCV